MINFCSVLNSRVLLEKLIISVPLSGRAIFHWTLLRDYISQSTPMGKYWMFCMLGNTLVQEGNFERVNFQYFIPKNDIMHNIRSVEINTK